MYRVPDEDYAAFREWTKAQTTAKGRGVTFSLIGDDADRALYMVSYLWTALNFREDLLQRISEIPAWPEWTAAQQISEARALAAQTISTMPPLA